MLNFQIDHWSVTADELHIYKELKTDLANIENFGYEEIFQKFDYQIKLLSMKNNCFQHEICESFQYLIYYFSDVRKLSVQLKYAILELEEMAQNLNKYKHYRTPLNLMFFEFFENELRNEKLKTRGGKRANSGRKSIPSTLKKQTVSIRLTPQAITKMKRLSGGNNSRFIENLIQQELPF